MALSMTFKNPCVYTEEEAKEYLVEHGWDKHRDGLEWDGTHHESDFYDTYGMFNRRGSDFHKMINKILDIEIEKRCFRKYTTRHDLRRLNDHYCVDDEPHYCKWEKDFIRSYVINHKDEPVIDILMVIPSVNDMVDYIDNEMFRKRTIRPISDRNKVEEMAKTFIAYISRGTVNHKTFFTGNTQRVNNTTILMYQQSSDQFKEALRDQLNIL